MEFPRTDDFGTEKTENTESTENTENLLRNSVTSVFSDTSVFSVFSVSEIHPLLERCIPKDELDVNRALFQLARELRSLLSNAQIPETAPYVEEWHKMARERIPCLEWFDVWCDFIAKWDSVKFPAGSDPMEMIVNAVENGEPPECAKRYGGKVGRLVHLCKCLQKESGNKPFFLSCRTAAALIGTTYPKAALWLRGLVREGVLEVDTRVKSNEYRAKRYRYLGD